MFVNLNNSRIQQRAYCLLFFLTVSVIYDTVVSSPCKVYSSLCSSVLKKKKQNLQLFLGNSLSSLNILPQTVSVIPVT